MQLDSCMTHISYAHGACLSHRGEEFSTFQRIKAWGRLNDDEFLAVDLAQLGLISLSYPLSLAVR